MFSTLWQSIIKRWISATRLDHDIQATRISPDQSLLLPTSRCLKSKASTTELHSQKDGKGGVNGNIRMPLHQESASLYGVFGMSYKACFGVFSSVTCAMKEEERKILAWGEIYTLFPS
jgi:hypothetical protein